VRCYFFNETPPAEPRLYFKQSILWDMLVYGQLAAPYTPPQFTVFPSDGQVGRWTMHYSKDKLMAMREASKLTPFTRLKQDMIDLLPGMLIRYVDLETSKFTVWQLTEHVIRRDNSNDLRLGVWPD
jgi:hypothetical protein